LASNSLLEGLVFAERIGSTLAASLPPRRPVRPTADVGGLVDDQHRAALQAAMLAGAGVLRTDESLRATLAGLASIRCDDARPCTESWETTNLRSVATAVAHAALLRTETRGSHWRDDYPGTDDQRWRVRQVLQLDPAGRLRAIERPVAAHGYERA